MNLRTAMVAALGGCSALMPVHVQAQGAPPGLYGKSIILAWTENRTQRPAGSGADFKTRSITQSLSIYVSSQGKLFSRRNAAGPKGGGKREGVGAEGRSGTGGLRDTGFEGDNLVVRTELADGARLITTSFTGTFSGCVATVRIARESGKKTMQVKSFADGRMIEVQSVSATTPTCSVRAGNVFGD